MKNNFNGVGIDASWLYDNGLGLISSRGLSKCMKTYKTLHNATSAVISGISADTIQFLNAHLINFVTALCHRVVVSREQEGELKMHTKVWHFRDDQLPVTNVEHALEMMGLSASLQHMNQDGEAVSDKAKKQDLKGKCRAGEESPTDSDGSDAFGNVNETPCFTTHREMYSPLVRLPPQLYPSLSGSQSRSHLPTSVKSAGNLMPLETDEDELVAELMEEEELDKLDAKNEAAYEQALWLPVRRD